MPLLLTVTVLAAHPAVEVRLERTKDTRPISGGHLRPLTGQTRFREGSRARNHLTSDPDSILGEPVWWGEPGKKVKLKVKVRNRTKKRIPAPGGEPEHRQQRAVVMDLARVQPVSGREVTGAGAQTSMSVGRRRGQVHMRTLGRMNTVRTRRRDRKAQSSPAAEDKQPCLSGHMS